MSQMTLSYTNLLEFWLTTKWPNAGKGTYKLNWMFLVSAVDNLIAHNHLTIMPLPYGQGH